MRILRLLLLILLCGCASAAAAQSIEGTGPGWSQIAGWLGTATSALLVGWATRLESATAREARNRAVEVQALHTRIDDAQAKNTANTLALADLRLELARSLGNHPTKTDFERALERLSDQYEALRDRIDSFIQSNQHRPNV